jgi:hypothetical protein
MIDIINKKIERDFGYYDLKFEWGKYGKGYVYGVDNGNGDGRGSIYEWGDGFGYRTGNGVSRTK